MEVDDGNGRRSLNGKRVPLNFFPSRGMTAALSQAMMLTEPIAAASDVKLLAFANSGSELPFAYIPQHFPVFTGQCRRKRGGGGGLGLGCGELDSLLIWGTDWGFNR